MRILPFALAFLVLFCLSSYTQASLQTTSVVKSYGTITPASNPPNSSVVPTNVADPTKFKGYADSPQYIFLEANNVIRLDHVSSGTAATYDRGAWEIGIPVHAGQTVLVRAQVKTGSGDTTYGGGRVGIDWYDSSGQYVPSPTPTVGGYVPWNSPNYVQAPSCEGVVPDGVVAFFIWIQGHLPTNPGSVWFANIECYVLDAGQVPPNPPPLP
jgi:hypothetical protein